MKFIHLFRCAVIWRVPKQCQRIMNPDFFGINEADKRKWLMRINLIIIIMTAFLMQVSASSFGQRITLKSNQITLRKAFSEVRKQTGYIVLCESALLNKAKPVKLALADVSLEVALEKMLIGQNLEFSIKDKAIVVKEKEQSSIIQRFVDYFAAIDVSGRIVDEKGEPIAGATIKVKGGNHLTNSGNDGFFMLKNVDENETLEITYIGFQKKEVRIGKELGNIVLQISVGELEEVSVNAGYYRVKERELTGSISRITSTEIENQPVRNFLATMQGRMPGVNITQNTGIPGSGFTIEIRGQNSLRFNGSLPLYIIDGVPYSAQGIGSTNTSANMPAENSPLNSINPSDIASLEVLKDADATAIYGSRGANGVVLITTKKGNSGKTSFNANYSSGFARVTRFMDMMNTKEYLAMRREAFANDGVTQYPANAYDINGTWDQNRDVNWQKELIGGTAKYTNIQSSISGGSQQTQFLLSGNYSKETTVFPGNFDYIKLGGRGNVNHESEDKKFRLNFSVAYTGQLSSLPLVDFTKTARQLPPNAPALYDASGKLNWENYTFENPLAILNGETSGNTYDLLANAVLSYDIGSGFVVSGNIGYTDLDQKQINLQPSTIYNPSYGLGSDAALAISNVINRNSWIIEPKLSWTKSIEKLKIDALLGTTFQEQKGNQLVTQSRGFANNSLIANPASAATNTVLNSEESLYKYQSVFTRINFTWAGKYLLNLTGRRDGSSRFGPGKKFGNFGAIGGAYIFSDEQWIKDKVSFLSFGKLRASYGISGNDQIGDYQYLDSYGLSGNRYQGIAGLQPSRLFNPDFGWESNRKLEIALETGFLNNRISTTIAWYNNRSSNQLVGIPLPAITGFSSIQSNLDAVVQNRGLEFSINTENIKHDRFRWSTSFNFTSAKNKLVSFPDLAVSTYKNQFVIGQPLNIRKVYDLIGLDPVTGVYQFKDVNNDGILSTAEDATTIVNLNPQYYGGLQNHFHYQGFDFDFLFQFVKQQNYNEFFQSPMPGTMNNQPSGVIYHWQKPNDVGPYQGYSNSNGARQIANTRMSSQSDAVYSDASYIRLKNIALSYVLPKEFIKGVTCKVSLQGQNVLTFSKYKGVDPEFRSSGYLPPLRVYTTSVQLTF